MSTEQPSGMSTSTAIVLGSVIVSLGLFFGLRSGKDDVPPPVVPPPVVAPPAVKPAPVVVVDKQRVIREAVAALEKHKKAFVEKCLAPSLAKKPDPPSVKFTFNVTFDAAGKVIARGVVEDRQTARPDVTACMNDNLPDIVVTPPGQNVLVDVPLELP